MQFNPAEWSFWVVWLYAFSVYCAVGFVWFWVKFARLEKAVARGAPGARVAFNEALRGFPNSLYAKMFGKHRLDGPETST